MLRLVLGALLAAPLAAPVSALAQAPPTLFKVVSARDEVVIGVAGIATVAALAQHLVDKGQVSAWQYTVRRTADGRMVHASLREVAILRHDTLRIEAFDPRPYKVCAPETQQPPKCP